ncbi:hypothetical protein AAG906_024853 [Vitis piasezkii]
MGFGKKSGPQYTDLDNPFLHMTHPPSPPPPSSQVTASQRSPRWSDYDAQVYQRPSAAPSLFPSHNSETSISARVSRSQDSKRARSPPVPSMGDEVSQNSKKFVGRSHADSLSENHNRLVLQRTRSPPLAHEKNHSLEGFRSPFAEAQQSSLSSSGWGHRPEVPSSYANLPTHQSVGSVSPYVGSYDSRRSSPTKITDAQAPKRTRSPPILPANEVFQGNIHLAQNNSKRPSISPPRFGGSSVHAPPASQILKKSPPSMLSIDAEAAATKPTSISRTRSPPLHSNDHVFQGNSFSTQDDTEREMQAKAKRLARFKVELEQPVQSSFDIANQKISANRRDLSMVEKQKIAGEHSVDVARSFPDGNALADHEGLEPPSIIIGLCPDMCPESERAERERKGDLDQYERLDGDRNQTNKYLAIKKYNRTAEREAVLIRPMPVLQQTIDYLLNLLYEPYDDRFLGMYNFLWDRMRAIRMDLRMQHIFDLQAISMLEQMIRLHIIAMHELCEYTKGEGFSEGFDAHLNIEQMNKTSVELFQMYDDHRKKGIIVPTEKEFRGYYALLKLDKHPGYKVEPAELSLDLAKMTPEMRQTPEVVFARDVARACRTSNFIAFFRLGKKASYLQACLMHAHFAKLRTQALASLHCGLQNNQGLPVAHVARWLGMEEEDIESLIEYHGFLIKEFEEPYMVKEGPFLNADKDYPTKCSELVHSKKSNTIVEDVASSCQSMSLPSAKATELQLSKDYNHEPIAIASVGTNDYNPATDEEMADFEAVSSPKDGTPIQLMLGPSTVSQQSADGHWVASVSSMACDFALAQKSPESQPTKVGKVGQPNFDALFRNSLEKRRQSHMEAMPSQVVSTPVMQERFPVTEFNYPVENSVPQTVVIKDIEDEELTDIHQEVENDVVASSQVEEVAEAKLKLILRIWRRRSSKRRELREQRQLAASAALDLLSLGPPIQHNEDQPSTFSEFNIDQIMRERYQKHEQSWSRLNVSEVVADKLSGRNPDSKCLCWKIIVCSQMNNPGGENMGHRSQVAHFAAGTWLLSKLLPTRKDDDAGLVISLPGLSMWEKWIPSQSDADMTCCLSIVVEAKFDNLNQTALGASAVLFLVSESIPLELQKVRLHNLLMSLPSGSCLPLLILSGTYKKDASDPSSAIIDELGLNSIDRSRVSRFSVVFLVQDQQTEHTDGFFSDEQLRKGLYWLASESPLQPILHCVKTRELVLTHLNCSLEVLENMNIYEVGPDQCISAFNDALDRSQGEICVAADANRTSWPCPEIALLEESGHEHRAIKLYLPSIRWSSAARIEPLVCALRGCKLPTFPDDISWLNRGSSMGQEIENQRLLLENCLIRFLTQLSKMMGLALAKREVHVMLQNSTKLELHNSSYYIVPKWVMIFRRVFNWRLMSLSSGPASAAYVLEHYSAAPTKSGSSDKPGLEGSRSSPYCLIHPTLDEMVEVGCSPLLSRKGRSEPEPLQPLPRLVYDSSHVQEYNTNDLEEDEGNFVQGVELAESNGYTYSTDGLRATGSRELVVVTEATMGAGKLSKLVEQCNRLQNMIDKKLSVYF